MTTYLNKLETARFDELTCALNSAEDPAAVLPQLVAMIAEEVPKCEAVTLTHSPCGRNPRFLAASTEVARAVDQLQVRCQQGPLLEAVDTAEALVSDDLATDPRWPRIGAHLGNQDVVRSVWVRRMCPGTGIVLALYASSTGVFDLETADDAARAADLAHPVIDNFHSANRAANLSVALETSRQIGSAMGVLMATRKITEDQAFDLLRATSQQLHRKVRDVAAEVVETGALPGRPPRGARRTSLRTRV